MCHANSLKAYCDYNHIAVTEVKALAIFNVLSSETEKCVAVTKIAQSRLPNSIILADLDSHLSFLNPSELIETRPWTLQKSFIQ